MSGRAPQVREAGGLRVILASMQYNQRGENQLRGRAGRQGDPGETLALLDAQDRLIQEAGSTALIEKYILPLVPQTGAPLPTRSGERHRQLCSTRSLLGGQPLLPCMTR